MTPEEAVTLLKDPDVLKQLVEITHDPALVKRLSEIASSETVSRKAVELLNDPAVADALNSLVHRTEFYQHVSTAVHQGAVWIAIPIVISAVTLLLVVYNTITLRRALREDHEA